jgi:hypothetical protein
VSICFTVESREVGTEGGIVKLFERLPSGDRIEVRPSIALKGDQLDESGQFRLHGPDWHKGVCIHLVAKLLSIPEDAESLVAWYATIGIASFFLGTGRTAQEIREAVRLEESFEITMESILSSIAKGVEIWKKRRSSMSFHVLSDGAVPCFLLQELHRDPSKITSARERIREQITNYLKQLGFPDGAIESVRNEIDEIDAAFVRECEQYADADPWCSYFRGLDASDLSLFRP